MMSRVDFYIVNTSPSQLLPFVCKLVSKAYASKQTVYIHAESSAQAAQLDDLLWTFRDGEFIPHALVENKASQICPIYIGYDNQCLEASNLLINLTNTVPDFFANFSRILEVVSNAEPQRSEARKKYIFYRDKACELQSHQIS